MERTAVGVIGCGFFAQNHLHAWTDLAAKGVEVAAVCDVDETKARAAADKFGVKSWYKDAETMFRSEKLDLVDIVTRVETHRDVVGQAIHHRIPTIVQKPFGPDLAACRAMSDDAQKAGNFLAVHENFRFQVPMRRIIELLRGEPKLLGAAA